MQTLSQPDIIHFKPVADDGVLFSSFISVQILGSEAAVMQKYEIP